MTEALPYREALGRVEGLRRGYTTGTTAAAACAAAARMLAEERAVPEVEVELPGRGPFGGTRIVIPVEIARREADGWTAGVRKDSGDDEDATNGLLILCRARYREPAEADEVSGAAGGESAIRIEAGEGIGRVTKPGLAVPPGGAAINPVPLRMIRRAALPYAKLGLVLELLISAPEGNRIALQTWNPRLGVEGGVSVIGTSGVVEPKSTKAFQASIALCVRQAALLGRTRFIITLGHVGEAFLEKRGIGAEAHVSVGDHVGFALERCVSAGITRVLLAGHVGKLAKVAAGLFDTHWSAGDARLETLAACAAACGASRETVRELLSLDTAEAAEGIIRRDGLGETYNFLAARAAARMKSAAARKGKHEAETSCAVLSLAGDLLGAYPKELLEENSWLFFR